MTFPPLISPVTAGDIVLRCLTVYGFIIIALRLSGKRQLGQLTPFDFVLLLLLSNAVQNAMTGPDTSLLGGMIAASTLMLTNLGAGRFLLKTPGFRHWAEGTPTILVNDGKVILPHLNREHIDQDELLQALREHGVSRVEDVRLAVLELDGSISVIQRDDLKAHPESGKPHHRRIRLPRHRTSGAG